MLKLEKYVAYNLKNQENHHMDHWGKENQSKILTQSANDHACIILLQTHSVKILTFLRNLQCWETW